MGACFAQRHTYTYLKFFSVWPPIRKKIWYVQYRAQIEKVRWKFRIWGSISSTVCLLFLWRIYLAHTVGKTRNDDNDRDDIHITIVQLMSKSNKRRSSPSFFTERCSKKLNIFFAWLVNNFERLDNNFLNLLSLLSLFCTIG